MSSDQENGRPNPLDRDADFSLDSAFDSNLPQEEGSAQELSETEKLRAEVQELKDKYLRALADSENIRKRAAKDRSDLLKYQGEKILSDLLTVVDDFELALANSGDDLNKFKEGVQLIHRNFIDTLGKWEVRGESGVGQQFDPNKHEAISKVPSEDAAPGTILNELKRAFFYKDKLLRPGVVVIVSE